MARRKVWVAVGFGIAALVAGAYFVYGGGRVEHAGTVNDLRVPDPQVAARLSRQKGALRSLNVRGTEKQVLFGDLHVHTTFSGDAFLRSLPLLGGEGAHPPADACDFARHCSDLDFYAITDHAESLSPRQWRETKDSVRQCNAVAGNTSNPDLVAFTGFEWTQVGATAEEHYGHKNVIFRDDDEEHLPPRPIAAPGLTAALRSLTSMGGGTLQLLQIPLRDFDQRQRYLDLVATNRESKAVVDCPDGVDTRDLPAECREVASTPRELFDKLDRWGFAATVIPHGTTWGFYTPPGYTYDKQLSRAQHDAQRQRLIEIYSGHGNSEEYRNYRAVAGSGDQVTCPAPTAKFEPCCHRAGEIIRARCGDATKEECERRVEKARRDYAVAGVAGHLTVPGATLEDWKDCGQCRDCYNPTFNHRPAGSAQYLLARGGFEKPDEPTFATFGFIASSDNHSARPGTGYKEFERRKMTEATGPKSAEWRERFFPPTEATPESKSLSREQTLELPPFQVVHVERQASFFMTGGLVAVHAEGRDRTAIWDALERREVYATSGERILLWFDLVNAPGAPAPMGSQLRLGTTPRFEVRAAGAFEQLPGCPDAAKSALGEEELRRLCLGECYNPGDRRRKITRIEVVRIKRQRGESDPVAPLIEDPWRSLKCTPSEAGCVVTFDDAEFVSETREVIYYVRAIQEPTPAVNAGGLRCKGDASGACAEVEPCYGDYRTSFEDDCLAQNEERAWSSPIFLTHDAKLAPAVDAGTEGVAR